MEDQSLEASVPMREIKIVLYVLEDLLDELEYLGSIRHRPSRRTWKDTLFWLSSPLLLHTSLAPRLDKITRKLRNMMDRSVEICLRQRTTALPKQYEEQFGFDGSAIIGRGREKQDVKELLLQNKGDSLSILPIVGQPGLGKTSLAKLVFEDEGEGWEFDFRVWISLDKNLSLTKIGTRIISEANNKSVKGRLPQVSKNYSLGAPFQLAHDVQQILRNSSCLIVLDNLISMNRNFLINLKELFGDKQKCAKVIVTTSSKLVAEVMRTSSSYSLGGLSEEHCWTIFSERAFGNEDVIVDPQYTEIGKKIVRRCSGNPMLAQSLGSMVHNQGMNTWLAARDKELWELEERIFPKSTVFSSFMAIYYSMHHTLQLCFLYLSVFPRSFTIDKDELIRQWSALDLFRSEHVLLSASLLGEIYTDDLLEASILEVVDASLVEMKCISSSVVLRVNNLAYDFLRHLTRDVVLHLDHVVGRNGSVGKPPFRYATLTSYSEESALDKYLLSSAKAVVFKNCEAAKPIADIFPVLRNTRLLDLSGCPFEELPASIDQLKQLRYLNISGFRIRALPNGTGCLQNLEFLDLSKTCIEVLPAFIGTFLKLKYLNVHGCDRLQNLPPALGDLKGLEHLNLSCCPRICKLPASFCGLRKLKRLDLSNCANLDQLPHPLQLESLENLNLEGCLRLKQLPESFGKLSFLRNLNLAGCSSLKQLPESIAELSMLEHLSISRIHRKLPDSLIKLQKLHKLNLAYCDA
uniref:Uncharacterized protein n=1 Tax=Avena sativa TaxID=4498 RepID=A0ACD5YAE1_AVESA